eukprot:10612-Eustigmatos_ZCMA.PRE.1
MQEDQLGVADKGTARTFYAAGVFYDVMQQFKDLDTAVEVLLLEYLAYGWMDGWILHVQTGRVRCHASGVCLRVCGSNVEPDSTGERVVILQHSREM